MKEITHVQFVSQDNGEIFYKHVRSAIDNFQKEGCEVEVQYQATVSFFSAVVIGRKLK
jgi:hypothetical protein